MCMSVFSSQRWTQFRAEQSLRNGFLCVCACVCVCVCVCVDTEKILCEVTLCKGQ
jgi:hypothetical protein